MSHGFPTFASSTGTFIFAASSGLTEVGRIAAEIEAVWGGNAENPAREVLAKLL